MDYFQIGIKLVAGYLLLFISGKLLGREQLSQVTLYDFISAVILGEIIGNALYDPKVTLWAVALNLILWITLKVGLEFLELNTPISVRALLEGKPKILVRDGNIDMGELRKSRLQIQQLMLMLRHNNIFALSDVQYAILEMDGNISVLPKPGARTPTIQDMNLPLPAKGLPFSVITDGQILKKNLQLVNQTEEWLINQLKLQGYPDISQIPYAELDANGLLVVIPEES